MWDFGHYDPNRCTGRRLANPGGIHSLLVSLPGVVLMLAGERLVWREDAELVARAGLGTVDCSWARLDEAVGEAAIWAEAAATVKARGPVK
jgi:pre-rRNA-processing protein TSR3